MQIVIAVLIAGGVFLSFFTVWIKALTNGAPVGIFSLVGMRLGGVPYGLVVQARITAVKAGIEISTDKIAAYAADRPIHYRDVLSTIYHNVGIDSSTYIRDMAERPVRILPEEARPIRELMGNS